MKKAALLLSGHFFIYTSALHKPASFSVSLTVRFHVGLFPQVLGVGQLLFTAFGSLLLRVNLFRTTIQSSSQLGKLLMDPM